MNKSFSMFRHRSEDINQETKILNTEKKYWYDFRMKPLFTLCQFFATAYIFTFRLQNECIKGNVQWFYLSRLCNFDNVIIHASH